MLRKIFKTGNSLVVSVPKESLQAIGLREGSEISLTVDEKQGQIILKPLHPQIAGIDAEFARQLDEFIAEYGPALEALAK
jgi:putative addiction module antidote